MLLVPSLANAQSAPAELEVRVVDPAHRPVRDARVYVTGDQPASALTPADGVIRFSDVDPGLYRIRVTKNGYDTATLDEVEALAGRRKIVDVVLAATLTKIGEVRARSSASASSVDVDEGNPLRRVSENLADALSKIAGVSVVSADQGNTLTISLRASASPTTTIGGAQVSGAAAGTLQAVAADLATGVSTDSSAGITSVGGSVNFRTLQPTRTWQEQLSASYGTYERTAVQTSLSGSRGKLGIAAQHAVRGGDSVLTGLLFADTSGQTYVHNGGFDRGADFLKLRYSIGSHFTVTGQHLRGVTRLNPQCDQYVTILPCGYGPGGDITNHATITAVGLQGQIGNVTVNANVSDNTYRGANSQPQRTLAGTPVPLQTTDRQYTFSFNDYSTVAIGRHTLLANVGSSVGHGISTTSGPFGGSAPYLNRYAYYVLGDTFKFSDRWSVTVADGANIRINQNTNAADLNIAFTPSTRESLTFSTGVYGGGTSFSSPGFFSDPSFAIYNCAADNVTVSGPSDAPATGMYRSVALNYSRRGKRGSLSVNAYSAVARGGSNYAQFPLLGLPGSALPPGYLTAISDIWHRPAICGAQPFDPNRVFVSELLSNVDTLDRSITASGQLTLGRNTIVQPSYSVRSYVLLNNDPRLVRPGSPYAVGAAVPQIPPRRASVLLDAVQPRANLEWVVNGTWTAANNVPNLRAYLLVSAGVTWTAQRGRVSLFANNLFNTDSGVFATTQYAQPLALSGGGSYLPVPTLLAPRSFTLLYSVRSGRQK